jgi:hypothetical protein
MAATTTCDKIGRQDQHARRVTTPSPPAEKHNSSAPAEVEANPAWRAVALGVQTKLAVSTPGDPYEQEADRVADQVMSMPRPKVQRACAECVSNGAPCPKCEEESKIQRRAEGADGPAAASDHVATQLGSGRPLEPEVRAFFEPRYGADFSGVRVHADEQADSSARNLNALAFTLGKHVVFRAGEYAPTSESGRRLIAHELTHVVQQRGTGERIQRQVACLPRATGEVAKSKTAGGILATDVVFTPSARQLDIGDFAVRSPTLPSGATDTSDWQRAMSMMAGDPSVRVAVTGFTDCAGSDAEDLSLRQPRAQAVIAAMPATVRGKILFSFTITTTNFIDTNATQEGRARNRGARVTFVSAPPSGQDPCDLLTKARNLDEYLFLVRCLETRLGLTAAADTPTALSALRQIYYGSATWSASQNPVWNIVIPTRPWPSGTDPTAALHPPLMTALRSSQVVEGTDIGHILTGIDAMLRPKFPVIPGPFGSGFQTTLANEEWATWAGDVGSAAAEWSLDAFVGTPSTTKLDVFFHRFASDEDLTGDLDAFAMRAGGGGAATPPAQLMRTISLTGPLSEAMLQYFRLTGSSLDAQRGNKVRNFVEAYGGVISGKTLTNRPAFVARLRPSVDEFARMFGVRRLLSSATANPQRPPGAPAFANLLATAIDEMTDRFVDWLVKQL